MRPVDWSPVEMSSDPTPGDTEAVWALARRYADTVDAINRQAANLQKLSDHADSAWTGKAADAFRSKCGDLSGHITKARGRYQDTADALGTFARDMAEPQYEADQARTDAVTAQAEVADSAPAPAAPAGSPPPSDAEVEHARQLSDQHDAAQGRLRAAVKRAQDAKSDYDAAAKRAHDAIHGAVQHDGVHDSWWDKVAGWVQGALKYIAIAIIVLAVVAILIASAGTAAPALLVAAGAYMETAAFALTAVSLIGHTALAATGKGSWLDVAMDGVGLVTFGLGRFGMTGEKLFGKALPSLKGSLSSATDLAKDVAGIRAGAQALRDAHLPGVLFRLAGDGKGLLTKVVPHLGDAMPGAIDAASKARALVELPEHVSFTAAQRVLSELNVENAERLAKFSSLNKQVPNVLRNYVRAANAVVTTGVHTIADGTVVGYTGKDVWKQFHLEPAQEKQDEAQVQQIVQHFATVGGTIR